MIYRALLIKYAEIGIKGQNRYVFEDALCDKVREKLKAVADGFTCVREQGRIFVSCPEEYDFDEAIAAIKTIFGVWAICPAAVIEDASWDNLTQKVGDFIEAVYPERNFSFKVEARRADKKYPIQSPEICANMGGYLLERFPELTVNVHEPDVKVQVEIRTNAYVFTQTIPGPGGMPVGANGRAMLLLSGGIDSPWQAI